MGVTVSGLATCPSVRPSPSLSMSVCPPVPPTPPAGLQPSLVPPPQTQNEWEVAEQRWREGLTRCREEAEAHLREVQERVDRLPQQVGVGLADSPPAVPTRSCPPTPCFR